MSELAKHVVVRRAGSDYEFTIDGEPFPWHVSADGIHLSVQNSNCPAVTITLLAERVDVLHALKTESQESK